MAYYGKRKWLEDIRYKKRWSQSRTAVEAGISQAMYSRIELGYNDPSQEQASAIAKALGFDVGLFETQDAAMREAAV